MSHGRSGPFQLRTSRRFRYHLKASASAHGSESVELDEPRVSAMLDALLCRQGEGGAQVGSPLR